METLRVIAGTHAALRRSSKLTAIYGEFNRMLNSGRRRNTQSGWLLVVLHTTRALDTALSELLKHKGWTSATPGLGAYLSTLASHSVLQPNERNAYQKLLVNKRNKYMHEAGAMPQSADADAVLVEMHGCFVNVFSRV